MKAYGVYAQFYPLYRYEPELLSIWIDREEALLAARNPDIIEDLVWVQEIKLNSTDMNVVQGERTTVKTP